MAKESKSNFELKKGKRFQFDLSKNPKRIFDLVKDENDAPIAKDPVPAQANSNQDVVKPESKPKAPESSALFKEKEKPDTKKDEGHRNKQDRKKSDNHTKSEKSTKTSPQPTVDPVVTGSPEDSGNESGGSNKWMWIIGAIVVVAIIAWLCVRGCSSSNDNGAITEPTVEAAEAQGTSEEEAVVEEATTEVEAEQPASSDEGTEGPANEDAAPVEVSSSTATPSETVSSATNATSAVAPATASAPSAEVSSDIEAEAMKVIRGEYGTGLERKLKLGSKYREIQNRVNELKRQGAF